VVEGATSELTPSMSALTSDDEEIRVCLQLNKPLWFNNQNKIVILLNVS
jgi:hypothetical protein